MKRYSNMYVTILRIYTDLSTTGRSLSIRIELYTKVEDDGERAVATAGLTQHVFERDIV